MAIIPSAYIKSVIGGRDPILDGILRKSLLQDRMPTIQVDDNAGRVLQLITMLLRPKRIIEIGTLFGYSTIYLARGLPKDGLITTLEVDQKAGDIALRNFSDAGVLEKIEVIIGDANDYLKTVEHGSVDLIFVDGDKKSYPEYLKNSFPLIREGGLIVADDAFAQGDFGNEAEAAKERQGIKTYNRAIAAAGRTFSAFIGTENGLLVSMKV